MLAGVWLMLAPFDLGYGDVMAAVWKDVVIGLNVLVLALFREAKPLDHEGVSWTNFVLGVWLLVAPFVAGYGDVRAAVANDISGRHRRGGVRCLERHGQPRRPPGLKPASPDRLSPGRTVWARNLNSTPGRSVVNDGRGAQS